jgi:hypothetical protein
LKKKTSGTNLTNEKKSFLVGKLNQNKNKIIRQDESINEDSRSSLVLIE